MDKTTLKQFQQLVREIEDLEREKSMVFSRYLSPAALSGMPGGTVTGDSVGRTAIQIAEYQALIDAKLDELITLREQIEAAIEGLPAEDRRLVRLRYIDGKRWEQIAVDISYSYRQTLRRHGHILQRLRKKSAVPGEDGTP